MIDKLVIRGAKEHNLKNVSLELPRDKLIVFTGLSGSGKSSLAFDTIYAEGQRRYVESLSAYARQFLGQMDKPNVDFIEGLSPAISIDQKSSSRNPRSTVGTITEVYDYLRLLYARIGHQFCPHCNQEVQAQSSQQIADQILSFDEGTRFQILAPVVKGRKGNYESLMQDLKKKGFSRIRLDGQIVDLSTEPDFEALARYENHDIEVVVDRLVARAGIENRLAESLSVALDMGDGVVLIHLVPTESQEEQILSFSQHFACASCGASFEELAPRNFSFNSPYGACANCAGLGTKFEVDPELVIPNSDLSISQGAIAPWAVARTDYYNKLLSSLAQNYGFSLDTPWRELPFSIKQLVLYGSEDEEVHIHYKNRFGRVRSYATGYEGVVPYLQRRHKDAESEHQRSQFQGYMREINCPKCKGARLNPSSLAVKIDGKSIFDLSRLPISSTAQIIKDFNLTSREQLIADRVLKEISSRLQFLLDVGLNYLSLDRSAGTLAGGEAQRIRLASQIGSGLVGVLYVLDEPSIGLHQRDNHRLIETLIRLRDLGNSVIVVEHDEDTIKVADYIVDIGPGAGENGGKIVSAGSFQDLISSPESLTGQYLSGKRFIALPTQRRNPKGEISIKNAREHNLKNIDVSFPLGCLVAVTGVSGSGKSTLVNDILHKALMQKVYRSKEVPGRYHSIDGVDQIDKVIDIDQSPIGRTPRSNPATYIGCFDGIRRLFSQTNEAKVRGYLPGRFSFNVPGGRCEACSGDGTIKIEMHFLPDIYVPCEICKGSRYNRETLEVTFKGKNIAQVLDMPCSQALEFFENQPSIVRHLQTLVDVGLGYVRLGQSAPSLSGGEAQRIKLSAELSKRSTGKTVYILDEPTTGLHFEDIRKLLNVLSRLVDSGNSVIVIEHNLDVIKTADWIIDLGPEGGDGGGQVIAEGPPEQIILNKVSHTAKFLEPLLKHH